VKKEKLYHQIAHACLQVLKSPKADSKEQVKAVYDAIDNAFQNQSALLSSELEDCKKRLQLIGELDATEHNLLDAQQIARQDSAKH
jgi:ABC-type phosphate transport system auxiliary subunit